MVGHVNIAMKAFLGKESLAREIRMNYAKAAY
jgi:hypothetical protein